LNKKTGDVSVRCMRILCVNKTDSCWHWLSTNLARKHQMSLASNAECRRWEKRFSSRHVSWGNQNHTRHINHVLLRFV